MTAAIAQFMRELERAWDAHRDALVRRDLVAALGPLAAEPSVVHIPAMTGAAGILWDHATLVTQLGITHGTATGRAASGLAR